MNPILRYRRAQRRLRALFNPFTRAHCPTCATPCCRKPARIQPVDLILVEELGHSLPPVSVVHDVLDATLAPDLPPTGEPCDFLTATGCAFPADLRPFGCTAFICEPMRRLLDPDSLARVEAAVSELEAAHQVLLEALHAPSTNPQ